MTPPVFRPMGAQADLVEYEDPLALHRALADDPAPGQLATVPAETTLLVQWHPGGERERIRAHLRMLIASGTVRPTTPDRAPRVTIDVRYDGPDLPALAELLAVPTTELIRRHTTARWTVAFIGFAPGFGYLTSPDWNLDIPRRESPRTAVPAGAVATAGRYSGVYPRSSPGGWQLLGRTPVAVWSADRTPPALLTPGATVQFRELP